MTPAQLQSLFNTDPGLLAEYQRHMAGSVGTDKRNQLQWFNDFLLENPGALPDLVNRRAMATLSKYPDIKAQYDTMLARYPGMTADAFFEEWANSNPDDPRLNDPSFLDSIGLSADDITGNDIPAEQALLNYALEQGQADIEGDALRKQMAADMLASYGPALDNVKKTIGGIYDGSILQSEYGANDEAAATQQSLLAEQMAARQKAFEDSIAALYTAQDPVNAARLSGADAAGAAVNIAAQREQDKILANFARDGYVGGNTGLTNSLFRASIDGRQGAAGLKSQAVLDNAQDIAGIGRYAATEGRTLSDYGSSEKRTIGDSQAQRKFGLFEQDIARRLSSLSLPANALQTEFQVRNMADDYGQSGFDRMMKNLQYFRTNPSAAPGSTPVFTKPVDSGYENLGAGLVNVAGNIANANNWWQKPKTTTKTSNPNLPSFTDTFGDTPLSLSDFSKSLYP